MSGATPALDRSPAASSYRPRWTPRRLDESALGHRPWAYVSPPFRALHHHFRIRCCDAELGHRLAAVLADLRTDEEPAQYYSIVDRGASRTGRYAVYWGDQRINLTRSPETVAGLLLWHVNAEVCRTSCDDFVLLHAAAASLSDRAVILPAPMESGKTTTVAGLVRRGFSYLTDEAAALDPATGQVVAFPKALAVDAGSWEVLADLAEYDVGVKSNQWQLPVSAIRPEALVSRAVPRAIVAPAYRPGERTRLEPVSRAEMVYWMADSTFHFQRNARRNLDVLSEVARACLCYRLVVSDLDRAVDLVAELVT